MKKISKLVALTTMTAVISLSVLGCNNKTGNETTQATNVTESTSISDTTQGTSQEVSQENTTETTKETIALSENINKDMESMNAMDVVNQLTFGISIGNTLDATNYDIAKIEKPYRFETAWGNPKITQELIDSILDSGMNVIRIPVSWTNHIGPAPDYEIVPSWMERVQEVVDYAYNKGAFVILNIHHEDWNYPYYDKEDQICAQMEAIWGQIAEVFKDYDEHLIFEGQNEPRKVGTGVEWTGGDKEGWEVVNKTNMAFVNTIRNSGGSNPYRILMIPPYAANPWNALTHLTLPENDDRIIISVHSYEPYEFALNIKGRSNWNDDKSAINSLCKTLSDKYTSKGIPVIIGEFGAMNKNNLEDRAAWAEYYMAKATGAGVHCLWWDNGVTEGDGELFGLFDRGTYECTYPEILEALKRGFENPIN